MPHSDARSRSHLLHPSSSTVAGAHRRRTLQGPGKIVLPRTAARNRSKNSSMRKDRSSRDVERDVGIFDYATPDVAGFGGALKVSLVVLAKSLGATPARSQAGLLSVAEGSTSLAGRSVGGLSRVFATRTALLTAGLLLGAGGEREASTSASVPEQV